MKIQFDSNLAYQQQAVEAILGVFEGQETSQTTFTVTAKPVFNGRGQGDGLQPETAMRVVFRDSGFANDIVKVNAVQILKQAGIEDVRSV